MSESAIENFSRRLDARHERHRQERREIRGALFGREAPLLPPSPSFDGLSFEEAVAAYDDWVEARRRAWAGEPLTITEPEAPSPPSPRSPSPAEPRARRDGRQGRLEPIRALADIDRAMTYTFALDEFLPSSQDALPTLTSCDSLAAFAEPLGRILPKYRSRFSQWKAAVHARPGERLEGNPLSCLAVHIPRQGTYINLWQIARMPGGSQRALLENPHTLRRAVASTASERWGHGFVEAYAEWGQDLHEAGLGALHLARRLGMPIAESRWAVREAVMSESAMFTTTGWSLWIGEYLAQRTPSDSGSEGRARRGDLRLSQLWDALKRLVQVVPLELWASLLGTPVPGLDRLMRGFSETLRWLLLNTELDASLTNRHMRLLQKAALLAERYQFEVGGVSIQAMLSQNLLSRVEAHLGPMLVPYAVLLAANLDFSGREDVDELRQWLDADVWQNVDARLLMLTKLDASVRHNVTTLMSTAVHELGLAPLDGMQWT